MTIDLIDYFKWARTKRPPDLSVRDQLLDAALGLAGESAEFLDVIRYQEYLPEQCILEEAGDILFYAAWMLDVFESIGLVNLRYGGEGHFPSLLDIPARESFREPDIMAAIRFGRVVDAVKKYVFHRRPLDGLVYDHIRWGLVALHRALVLHGTRLDVAMNMNIVKLDIRYPNGFVIREGFSEGVL